MTIEDNDNTISYEDSRCHCEINRTEAQRMFRTVPEEIIDGLYRYVERRIPTGAFLKAVLENDLLKAVQHAHPVSLANIREIVLLVSTVAPDACWGSKEIVTNWLAKR